MQRFEKNGLCWLQFDHLSECKKLRHGVFLRHGGVSQGEYGSLNLSLSGTDHPENVWENRRRACEILGVHRLVHCFQVHGNMLVEAKECLTSNLPKADGIMTNEGNEIGLLIGHADCQAAIFYDPIRHVLANVHCGWRGNVCNIYQATVESLKNRFGSCPKDLLVGISPSLGPEAAQFIHYEKELPPSFYPFQVKPYYFDLWQIARWQLESCGVRPEHIEMAQLCTYSEKEDCFSYRRCKDSGRHGTIAVLL